MNEAKILDKYQQTHTSSVINYWCFVLFGSILTGDHKGRAKTSYDIRSTSRL